MPALHHRHAPYPRDLLDRITVNFLRHECSAYEQLLGDVSGCVGVDAAYRVIRNRVLDTIVETYPRLRFECRAQRL